MSYYNYPRTNRYNGGQQRPVRQQNAGPRLMRSKFAGTCRSCGARFPEGAMIQWSREEGARHATPEDCEFATEQQYDGGREAHEARQAQPAGLDLTNLPSGRYLVTGHRMLKVDNLVGLDRNDNRWAGWVFVKSLRDARDRGDKAGAQRPGGTYQGPEADALTEIMADPTAAAQAFGQHTGTCGVCGLMLTDPVSIEAGIGPICAAHYGYDRSDAKARVQAREAVLAVASSGQQALALPEPEEEGVPEPEGDMDVTPKYWADRRAFAAREQAEPSTAHRTSVPVQPEAGDLDAAMGILGMSVREAVA